METKIKDITGAEITVTDLKEAVRQCRECLASPYLMPSGHTVGENHAYKMCIRDSSGGFQFIQCLAGLFQTPEEIRHTRIVLVDEIMAHNAAVLG